MNEPTKICTDVFLVDKCSDSTCDYRYQNRLKFKQIYDRRPGETPRCLLHNKMKDIYDLIEVYKREGLNELNERIFAMDTHDVELGFHAAVMAMALAKELPELEERAETGEKEKSGEKEKEEWTGIHI